jgi:hypothetical protein
MQNSAIAFNNVLLNSALLEWFSMLHRSTIAPALCSSAVLQKWPRPDQVNVMHEEGTQWRDRNSKVLLAIKINPCGSSHTVPLIIQRAGIV